MLETREVARHRQQDMRQAKMGVQIPMRKGIFRELCKNGLTDRDAVWVMDSGGHKERCVTWGHIGASW